MDLTGAFLNAGQGVKVGPGIDSTGLGIFGAMEEAGNLGLASEPPYLAALNSLRPPIVEPLEMPELYIDDSPQRTAAAAEDTGGGGAGDRPVHSGAAGGDVRKGVVLNELTRQDKIAAQTFTKRMSVASPVLSIVGVVFAGVALLFAAQSSPAPVVNVPLAPAPTINVTVVPTPEPMAPAP